MDIVFNYLNGSIFFNGLVMFIMNIGSKYLIHDIPKSTDILFNKYKFSKIPCYIFNCIHINKKYKNVNITYINIFTNI